MKNKWISACLLLLVNTTVLASDNQLSAEEQASGWTLLFDGQDLSKWRNFKQTDLNANWVIKDGAMGMQAQGGGDIVSKATYQDFELQLEWKISSAGNSGIFILADETGRAIYSHAPEIQILDNARHADNKIDSHLSGSLYDMVAAPSASHKVAGEWNQVRIRLKDEHLTVWQNGVVTVAIVLGSTTWQKLVTTSKFASWQGFGETRRGHIGLQDHGDPVWFKNIKIREL